MYAVYQNNYRVSPVMKNVDDAGDWQTKFTNVLTDLEVKPFEIDNPRYVTEPKRNHRRRQRTLEQLS